MRGQPTICDTASEQAVKNARKGNGAAFEQLYYLYKRRVYDLCYRFTKNALDSEDLTQEVFLRVHRNLNNFRGDAAFGTWLHRVATSAVMMHFRKRRIQTVPANVSDLSPGCMSRALAQRLSVTSQAPKHLALKQALAALPRGRRKVVILHDLDGFTHHEIALRLGIGANTSKSQLHRARKKLRVLLWGTRF